MSFEGFRALLAGAEFDGSVAVAAVRDARGQPLPHAVVRSTMRVDLPQPLASGESFVFQVDWSFRINDHHYVGGRTGCERFESDGNWIYELAQWFPRMVAYTDTHGWQHEPYLGRGEFTLEFGDYLVRITVPDDHVVASTGRLQNPEEVLTETQRTRLAEAESAEKPRFVITPEEARASEKNTPQGKKTWIFFAENVRDFAFASSRKFIWDAQGHRVDDRLVMAMSFYPNEGEPLWSRYSTHAIIHTLDVYSRMTFPYPYPVAISVNGPVGGMEYPMICFNGPRPEKDGTYSDRTKYGLITVVIHEVGHNWFPMVVNSDERRWTWLDEGFNTFLQFLAEQEWEERYPSRRGEPRDIVDFMTSSEQRPIMTQSDSLVQFHANAYSKTATALNVLRETVLGRELFDFAFREYARRWQFRRPDPADFFRTIEDASGVDLDWYWRGWFYGTEHCDLAIRDLRRYVVDTLDPDVEKPRRKAERDAEPTSLTRERNEPIEKRAQRFPELRDFYNSFDQLDVTEADRKEFRELIERLSEEDRKLLATKLELWVVDIENVGGLVMPVILDIEHADDTRRELRIPADIWRRDDRRVRKLIISDREIRSVTLDSRLETADADLANNRYPPKPETSRLRLTEEKKPKNAMQEAAGSGK